MYQQSAPETIRALFASIAPNYDRANTAFSFGLHKKWNQKLINSVGAPKRLLDLCAGTGEIALGFLKKHPQSEAVLLDFCPEMLAIALQKGHSLQERFEVIQADAQSLPLKAHSVNAATIAYGIRNVKEPLKCFKEVYRVLTPGGCLGILEPTRPTFWPLRYLHRCYTYCILPILGKMAAKNKEAYKYLASSVAQFSSPERLIHSLKEAGFENVQCTPLLGGTATVFVAHKSSSDICAPCLRNSHHL